MDAAAKACLRASATPFITYAMRDETGALTRELDEAAETGRRLRYQRRIDRNPHLDRETRAELRDAAHVKAEDYRRMFAEEAFEDFIVAYASGMNLRDSCAKVGLSQSSLYKLINHDDPTGQRRARLEQARQAYLLTLVDKLQEIALRGQTKEKRIYRTDADGNEVLYERHEFRADDSRALIAMLGYLDPLRWNQKLVSNVGTMIAKDQLDYSKLSDDEIDKLQAILAKAVVVDAAEAPALPSGAEMEPF